MLPGHASLPGRISLGRPELHGQYLAGDQRAMLGQRRLQLRVAGGPVQRDPVGYVQAVVLARLLDQPDDLAGEALAP